MLNSIGNTALVRCREVVRFSEGPLSEARLYSIVEMVYVVKGRQYSAMSYAYTMDRSISSTVDLRCKNISYIVGGGYEN